MNEKTNILLTGATGLVGKALLKRLLEDGSYNVTVALRSGGNFDRCTSHVLGEFSSATDWSKALLNQRVVIHAAGRAQRMKDLSVDTLDAYRRVNVTATLRLARQAAASGVKRFIFVSSIKVNGEQTPEGQPFTCEDLPAPQDAYGISKLEAERGLQQLASETGMELVIIRPPLVYGPGVKGNFSTLLNAVEKKLPLPFGAINNRRSLVAIDNLVDLTITCINHPAAANQVFLAGDGQDFSTTELLRSVARALGKPSRLIPISPSVLLWASRLLGYNRLADALLGSLQVDISKARNLLEWAPPISVEEGLRRCIEYRENS